VTPKGAVGGGTLGHGGASTEGQNYRQQLYDSYVSTHIGVMRDVSLQELTGVFPYFRNTVLPHLPTDRSAAIVDIGCGYGGLLAFLQAQGYRSVVGVDVSPQQVEAAGRLGFQVVEAEMMSYLRSRIETFEAIVAIDVLEHVPKDEMLDTLRSVYAALKPGGRLIVQTANADGPFGGRYRYGDFTHELAFTTDSISQVLRAVGFSQVAVHPIEPTVHGAKSVVRWALWRGIRFLLTSYLAIETGVTRGHILSQNLVAVARKSGASSI
jgi:2-polyprenyl-3-methyl-5-hydroxy-6-metoxy-1,4-benzoquinol methylase